MLTYELPYLPDRPGKPRNHGLTMVMDKGLSIREAENFISACSEYTDLVKLGFGTGIITPNLQVKVDLGYTAEQCVECEYVECVPAGNYCSLDLGCVRERCQSDSPLITIRTCASPI